MKKSKKDVYGYDRKELPVTYRGYDKPLRWLDFITYVAGIVLGILFYYVL